MFVKKSEKKTPRMEHFAEREAFQVQMTINLNEQTFQVADIKKKNFDFF